jgi:AcrR family transcriptional regulator
VIDRAYQTQRKILTAARRHFAEKGPQGARIDAVAAESGCNKERIYSYFKNKRGLFVAALQDCFAEILALELELAALTEKEIPKMTGLIFRAYMDFHQRTPEFWRLLAWANLDGEIYADALEGMRDKTFSRLRELYQQGQAGGAFRAEVSFETYLFSLSALSFFYHSNRHSMSKTLGLNLSDETVRGTMTAEIVALLGGRNQP